MKVLIGLGNPGAEYAMTRHNAGMMFVDKLSESLRSDYGFRRKKEIMVFESKEMVLLKSANIFMNESGRFFHNAPFGPPLITSRRLASEVVRGGNSERLNDLFIAHDDLDIKLGEYKIQFGKGPKDHGGVNSIEGVLGTKEFWRIRIGIDNRRAGEQESGRAGEDYVLEKFSAEEKILLDQAIEKAVNEVIKATN